MPSYNIDAAFDGIFDVRPDESIETMVPDFDVVFVTSAASFSLRSRETCQVVGYPSVSKKPSNGESPWATTFRRNSFKKS